MKMPPAGATQAQQEITLIRHSSKVTSVTVSRARLLFWESELIAIHDHYVYFPDQTYTGQQMKAINELGRDSPHVRLSPSDFDFTVAAAVGRNILPLTQRRRETE